MVDIKVDTSSLLKMVDNMIESIDHFKRVDIGNALSDWQVHDMHRHRPFTMRSRARGMAQTKVRPHSLYETTRSALARGRVISRLRRALRSKRPTKLTESLTRTIRSWSSRPILRHSLEEQLDERLRRSFEEKIKWR